MISSPQLGGSLIKASHLKLSKRLQQHCLHHLFYGEEVAVPVVMAMRTQGGDEAVLQILNRTRELYKRRIQETASVDQLASIFAECAITEAQPLGHEQASTDYLFGTRERVAADARGVSILEKTGRSQIMLDAFADGSSFICLQCGGLVSTHRRDEHYAYWCSNM
ncbi:Uncharacterized protein HA466_0115640 [Hirschfeldia incana]|nr:Uncharacterized protein HA466_0115640 [Hirschfeldia incana]